MGDLLVDINTAVKDHTPPLDVDGLMTAMNTIGLKLQTKVDFSPVLEAISGIQESNKNLARIIQEFVIVQQRAKMPATPSTPMTAPQVSSASRALSPVQTQYTSLTRQTSFAGSPESTTFANG